METSYSYTSKCSKILNTFLFLFSNKMLVFRAESQNMLVKIANREDSIPLLQSDLGLHCLSTRPFWKATSVQNFKTFTVGGLRQGKNYTCFLTYADCLESKSV